MLNARLLQIVGLDGVGLPDGRCGGPHRERRRLAGVGLAWLARPQGLSGYEALEWSSRNPESLGIARGIRHLWGIILRFWMDFGEEILSPKIDAGASIKRVEIGSGHPTFNTRIPLRPLIMSLEISPFSTESPSALDRLDIGFGAAARPLILWLESESRQQRCSSLAILRRSLL